MLPFIGPHLIELVAVGTNYHQSKVMLIIELKIKEFQNKQERIVLSAIIL